MLLSEAITAVRTEGGFDTTSTGSSEDVLRQWVRQAVNEALSESKWRKQRREIGPTVAGQAQYVVPEEVVDVETLRVGGGRAWALIPSVGELWEIQSGNGYFRNAPGGFLGTFEPDADSVIELWPVPTESDLPIEALCAIGLSENEFLGFGLVSHIPLPEDLARPIAVNGAVAIGLRLLENRHEDAAAHDALKDKAVATLKRRANSRIGSGPSFIPVRQP